jgi:glycosyltransferase involved in cell wall biosynthesis
LVGSDTDQDFSGLGEDIDGLGYVEDPGDEFATWAGMIVPIRVGGGTRVKIAQAFSRKCPVVSTSLGAFGYDLIDGKEILIADDPDRFAIACARLIEEPRLGATLAENAWITFVRNWTWKSFHGAVESAVRQCMASGQHRFSRAVPRS